MAIDTLPRLPGGVFGLGALNQFRSDSLGTLERAAALGDIAIIPFGPRTLALINQPDLIHQVLVEHAPRLHKTRRLKEIMRPSLGNGLLVNDGEDWRRQRRLAQPAFHHKRIEAYGAVMVEHTERMLAGWRDGETREIDHDMMRLTLGIVSKTLFDADTSAEADRLGEAISIGQELLRKQFNTVLRLPAWVPTRDNRMAAQALKVVDEAVMGFIRARRASGEDKGDLLSMLLLAQDEDGSGGMSDKQARDESFTLFVAGHETTANALTWTWWLLSQHPEVEARLHRELGETLGGRSPGLSDLARLNFAEKVIKESMRIRPPAWITSREPIEDVVVGGHTFKHGTFITISPWTMHHDRRYFDRPDEFVPERWTPEFERQLPKFAYIPFGGGPRICIGNQFALMEARLVLATVAQRYRLRYAGQGDPGLAPLITLRPKRGMPMTLEGRDTPLRSRPGP
jgi:cytochrome P450